MATGQDILGGEKSAKSVCAPLRDFVAAAWTGTDAPGYAKRKAFLDGRNNGKRHVGVGLEEDAANALLEVEAARIMRETWDSLSDLYARGDPYLTLVGDVGGTCTICTLQLCSNSSAYNQTICLTHRQNGRSRPSRRSTRGTISP
jgi:hypothetical protein